MIFGETKAKVNIDMEDIFHDQIIRGSIKIPRSQEQQRYWEKKH